MIEIKDIEIVYDDYIILNKTDIDIPEHAITLIRGISGSGKTSLLYRIGLISEDDHFTIIYMKTSKMMIKKVF